LKREGLEWRGIGKGKIGEGGCKEIYTLFNLRKM
jgi:hypothetical protein